MDSMKGKYLKKHCKNTEYKRLRRLLAVILCLCLLASFFQIQKITASAGADIDSVTVTYEGKTAEKLTLPQNERAVLKAECSPETQKIAYQWQILADIKSELWLNIYDATKQSVSLSYPMLSSLLDEAGSAYIRCRVTADNGDFYSDNVCVTVAYIVSDDAEYGVMQTGKPPVRKAAARAPKSNPEYVDIFVNYLDAVSGQPIYTGFTAQIEYGTSYSNTVISPTYLGYAPFYNADNPSVTVSAGGTAEAFDDATVISLNISSDYIGSQYIVNVYYKAIDVPYAVRYYFQNINDDMYTENMGLYRISSAKTGTIISNEQLELQDPDTVKGFTKLYHYPEAVAADGSTVFQCYYDRNYYMVKFDTSGGYGTEPIYARYGTPFVVNTPTRHGYIFDGWDDLSNGSGDGIKDILPDAVPDENRTYKALWRTVDTTYTAVYWLQNADDDDYSYIGSVKENAKSGDVVSGSDNLTATTPLCGNNHNHTAICYPDDFSRYIYEGADENVTVNGDGSTVVNVYYIRKTYTLRFYYVREKNGVYQLVGGSTYPFGNKGFSRPDPYTVQNLLAKVPDGSWGKIKNLPVLKAQYADKYTVGTITDTAKGYTYHYLELSARFDANLTDIWPGEAFEPIEVDEYHTANGAQNHMGEGQWGHYAYLAGWNGEFKVKYTKDNSNSTIKGMFQRLDENLLYDSSEGTSDIVSFLGFFENGANISWSYPLQWQYEMYVPTLAGDTADLTHNGIDYKLYKSVDTSDNNAGIEHQTQPTLYGFTANGKTSFRNADLSDGRASYTARFFYRRKNHDLIMHNYNQILSYNTLLYQDLLDDYGSITPPYPSTLEKNAYKFGGWYYSPGCYDGSEYKAGDTMPGKNIGMYAKWTPVSHTVRFFRTYDEMVKFETTGNENGLIATREVTHGNVLGSVDNPSYSSGGLEYIFGGWFYMRAGSKTAYTPLDMPVTKELNVFADWGTHSPQPYRIRYALHIGEGDASWLGLLEANASPKDNKTYKVTKDGEERTYVYLTSDGRYHLLIAPDSAGFAYQGNTRTFYPKAGEPLNELYPAYNSGYYPTLASHSVTVEYEENKEEPEHNVFTFTYVYAANIAYRVEYRYADTGALITSAPGGGTVTKYSARAVVTERFAVIADYIPDAFYKRLILSVTDDGNGSYVGSSENAVVFYYRKNTLNAFYAVHHMLQKIDAAGEELTQDANGNYINYTESDALTEGIGEIGTSHRIVPQTFSGFSVFATGYIKDFGTVSLIDPSTDPHFTVTIQSHGTELYIFYTRNMQNYKVYHLKYGTDISSLSELTYIAGDSSNGVLLPIESGTGAFGSAFSATAKPVGGMNCVSNLSQTIILRANDAQNYIIFYYEPLQYTAEYIVWPNGGGTLSKTIEVVNGADAFKGSQGLANSGYRFDGWYLDKECTVPVGDKGTVTGSKLVPVTSNLDTMPEVNTFWAKFVPVLGDMIIARENGSDDEGNGDRVFVYRITAAGDPAFELFVSIKGNGSVTIKDMLCREYTVEQQNNWSWRYNDASQNVTASEGTTVTATFGGAPVKNKWLNGNSERITNRKG